MITQLYRIKESSPVNGEMLKDFIDNIRADWPVCSRYALELQIASTHSADQRFGFMATINLDHVVGWMHKLQIAEEDGEVVGLDGILTTNHNALERHGLLTQEGQVVSFDLLPRCIRNRIICFDMVFVPDFKE